jgi:hypothetical protein
MQQSLKNSPKTAIRTHPNYRVVQVSNQSGTVGMLLPHANIVVPDKQSIRRLGDIIALYEKLSARRFNYGSTSDYNAKTSHVQTQQVNPIELNSMKDLPLFRLR